MSDENFKHLEELISNFLIEITPLKKAIFLSNQNFLELIALLNVQEKSRTGKRLLNKMNSEDPNIDSEVRERLAEYDEEIAYEKSKEKLKQV